MFLKSFSVFLTLLCSIYCEELITFIIGGGSVKPNALPFQVSLQGNKEHFCGGTILNSKWILSAAHCITLYPGKEIEVLAGSNRVDSAEVRRKVVGVVYLREFVRPIKNDIVLLKLDRKLPTNNPNIKSVILPKKNTPDGTYALVSGWGYNETGKNPQTNLKALLTKTISNKKCREEYPGLDISDVNICTFTRPGEGFCSGDSGGPLIDLNSYEKGRAIQIGIVSATSLCALGKPDIYTRIYPYVAEIVKVIKT